MTWRVRYGSKFGNTKASYKGSIYHSKFECGYAMFLDAELAAGRLKEVKSQVVIPLVVNGVTVAKYHADFVVIHPDLTQEIIECKGFFTDYARLKWRLFTAIYEHEHPEIKITMVKYSR